jgi:hypothetical protein
MKTNHRYRIKTPNGWEHFDGVYKITKPSSIRITTINGYYIICSPDHRLLTPDGWVKSCDLDTGTLIQTKYGLTEIASKQKVAGDVELFDIINSGADKCYYSNEILSHNCEFVGSSNTLIDGSKLRMIPYRDPIKRTDDFKIYSDPSAQRLYMIVADTARGTGNDYSAFVVFDITEMPYQVVATYRNNKVSTLLYPTYIHHFAKLYNNALILVETNDIGKQVVDILHQDLEYDNLVYTALDGQTGQIITGGFSGHSRLGVKTTRVVKKLGCSNFKTMIESDRLIINDFDLLSEMYRFSAKGDSFEAESGNDDLVMCCVLLSWAMIQPYMRELTSTDLRQSVMNLQEKSVEEDLAPFGLIDDGHNESEVEKMVANTDDNWLQQDMLGFSSQRARPLMAVSDDSWLTQD